MEKETIYTEEVALLMKGMNYKEVIAEMEKTEGEHAANPFARATKEDKEHVIAEVEQGVEEPAENKPEEKTEE